jgi:hypothetical protein
MSNKLSRRKFLAGSSVTVASAAVATSGISFLSERAEAFFNMGAFWKKPAGNGQTSNGYTIGQSLRFVNGNNTYLQRTIGAGSNTTHTISAWVKQANNLNVTGPFLFNAQPGAGNGTNQTYICWSGGQFSINYNNGNVSLVTNGVYRDVSAWQHILVVTDTTKASNQIQLYINGNAVALTGSQPAQNTSLNLGTSGWFHGWGGATRAANQMFDGYLAEAYYIDGYAYDPGYFGQVDSNSGQWIPKSFSGSYGTNGSCLKFTDAANTTAATLGKDSSPNGNNWTPNGFATYDQVLDSPTNNFCTLNPIGVASPIATFSSGNLACVNTTPNATTNAAVVTGTIGMTSGKWYWEVTVNGATSAGNYIGIAPANGNAAFPANFWVALYKYTTAQIYATGGSPYNSNYGAAFVNGDTIGVALDLDAKNITFYRNNTSYGVAYSNIPVDTYVPFFGSSTSIYAVSHTVNFGQGGQAGLTYDVASGGRFKYTPPTGFKALCTANLPAPAIKSGSLYFDTVLRTGTGAAYSVNSLSFQPDLVWAKSRSTSIDHMLFDSARGTGKYLVSDDNPAEVTDATSLSSFNANGYSGGTNATLNASGVSYVDWFWKKGASAGFDIKTFSGNGTNQTVSHSLGAVPSLVIVKSRNNAGSWPVYHGSSNINPQSGYILFEAGPGFFVSDTAVWNNTAPTSSQFSVGASSLSNSSGTTYVAYLWAEVPGFSKFSSYAGNNNSDGPFVYCGFKPKYVWLRATANPGANVDWWIYDGVRDKYNPAQHRIPVDGPAGLGIAEVTNAIAIDILSNGFKIRTTHVSHNASGIAYIFAAFAEAPFKYATAR